MEKELARTKDELSIIREQQLEASMTETNTRETQTQDDGAFIKYTCETQTEDDGEIIELREQLQKSAEALNIKQNEADLLQQQLQSQRSEIDNLQHALTSAVFTHFVHTHTHTHTRARTHRSSPKLILERATNQRPSSSKFCQTVYETHVTKIVTHL